MTVADRIKQRRIELGLSQTDLAKRMGYSDKTSISKIENSENDISIKKITRVASALNTTASYLLGWKETEEDNNYYTNPETAELAQKLYSDNNYRVLFDAAKDSRPEDIQMAAEMLQRLKRTNLDG